MILHYLKMAFRSLMKHRVQSVLSIVGLAVGFVCFAYSLIWLRYERTFDSFHPNADRIYMLYEKNSIIRGNLESRIAPYPFAATMKEQLPEVEAATAFFPQAVSYKKDESLGFLKAVSVDTAFLDLFDVRILAGSRSFLHSDREIALTPTAARRLFGTDQVLGRTLDLSSGEEKTVTALVSEWKGHSSIPYESLIGIEPYRRTDWKAGIFMVCFRLRQDADTADFTRKLRAADSEVPVRKTSDYDIRLAMFSAEHLNFCPIAESYELLFKDETQIRQTYIRW